MKFHSPPNSTVYRADNQGNITSYATYDANGLIMKRVDVAGAAHYGVPTQHVLECGRNHLPDDSIRVQTPRTDPRFAIREEIP
ncbi:polymorphic toxin type 24 domain-containing protein [Ochrobactrum sp. BTU1]|uniref:polymorphic toxin type 24 domain-containing protein n=1 Tax=Ochrobactrum sp. BTU1 TaxID=2840456 RepID=UPI004045F777